VSATPQPAEDARWATFDCYGTLVDWNAGLRSELARETGRRLAPEDEDALGRTAHGHWRAFYEASRADRRRHVHVAQSHFHDIAPPHVLDQLVA
jgi:FMN phosphatase YigB (HAD superfamily)